jgi:hypothetical protein
MVNDTFTAVAAVLQEGFGGGVRKGNKGCGACCCFVSTVMEYNEACGGGNAIVRECLRVRRITVSGIVGFTDCTPVIMWKQTTLASENSYRMTGHNFIHDLQLICIIALPVVLRSESLRKQGIHVN